MPDPETDANPQAKKQAETPVRAESKKQPEILGSAQAEEEKAGTGPKSFKQRLHDNPVWIVVGALLFISPTIYGVVNYFSGQKIDVLKSQIDLKDKIISDLKEQHAGDIERLKAGHELQLGELRSKLDKIRRSGTIKVKSENGQNFMDANKIYGPRLKFPKQLSEIEPYEDSKFFAKKNLDAFTYSRRWPFELEPMKMGVQMSDKIRDSMLEYYSRIGQYNKAHLWRHKRDTVLEEHNYYKNLFTYILVEHIPPIEEALSRNSNGTAGGEPAGTPAQPGQNVGDVSMAVQNLGNVPLMAIASETKEIDKVSLALNELNERFFNGDTLGYHLIKYLYDRLTSTIQTGVPFEIIEIQKRPDAMYVQMRSDLGKVSINGTKRKFYIHEQIFAVKVDNHIRKVTTFTPSSRRYLTDAEDFSDIQEWWEYFYIVQ